MSKYDDKAAKALAEAKNDCYHPVMNRGIDLETGDRFCGDCGRVIEPYRPGTPQRFPGRLASDLIGAKLTAEFPNRVIRSRLFDVDPLGPNEFWCHMQVIVGGTTEHRYYTVKRTDSLDTATVERSK